MSSPSRSRTLPPLLLKSGSEIVPVRRPRRRKGPEIPAFLDAASNRSGTLVTKSRAALEVAGHAWDLFLWAAGVCPQSWVLLAWSIEKKVLSASRWTTTARTPFAVTSRFQSASRGTWT